MNWQKHPWMGVFPATLCPFNADESIDEEGLSKYMRELASVDGIKGLTCNGHTGEIMSLRAHERFQVTKLVKEAVADLPRQVKVISGVSAEGSLEAIDHALAAKEAGADGILLMPPHHWLRFGRSSQTAVGFFEDVAAGSDISIIVHQYPAWTKAGYTLDEMLEMVNIPQVVCIKMGTREMSRWLYDYEKIKELAPHISILTCHDEYLMPTLLEAGDGALIGFAGFVPELMVQLAHACLEGNLAVAKEAQKKAAPLARLVYNFGEPGGGAHQRMKCARWLMGKFPRPKMRRPLRDLNPEQVRKIRLTLESIGYRCVV
jgi:4-hydroxy-tetrahydrodipicolinate synthase